MKRFKKLIGATLNMENVKNSDRLQSFGVECTYLPDPVEDFDEFEFRTGYEGGTIIMSFAVEMGEIKRLMFAQADADNPDLVKGLPAAELEGFLSEKGPQILGFYEFVTA